MIWFTPYKCVCISSEHAVARVWLDDVTIYWTFGIRFFPSSFCVNLKKMWIQCCYRYVHLVLVSGRHPELLCIVSPYKYGLFSYRGSLFRNDNTYEMEWVHNIRVYEQIYTFAGARREATKWSRFEVQIEIKWMQNSWTHRNVY